ncbi:MAG: hypothetical protein ACOC22_02445 [bacterium]
MASKISEPTNQFIVANPYFGANFEFGDAPDDVRMCRYLNHIFNIYGKDVVIKGGSVNNIELSEDDILTISLNGGRIIQDKTLIKFNSFSLDMDISELDKEKNIVFVFTKFKYSEDDRDVDTDPNPFTFRLAALNTDSNSIYTQDSSGNLVSYSWDEDKNRIVLAAYYLDNIEEYLDSIEISGKVYYPRGNMDTLIGPLNYDGEEITEKVEKNPITEYEETVGEYEYQPIQDVFFRPFTQRIYQTQINEYDDGNISAKDTRFIDEEFNKINRLVGKDVVLDGLKVSNYYIDGGKHLNVRISSGEMITDDAYISIDEDIDLTYKNLHIYDDSGKVLLVSDFNNSNAIRKNTFRFKLVYIDSLRNPIDNFNIHKNRIVFAAFNFEKSGNSINNIELIDSSDQIISIGGTWSHNFESEFKDDDEIETRFLDRLYLDNEDYEFTFECYDCQSDNDGFLRFKSSSETIDAKSSETSTDEWTTKNGTISIPSLDYYNLIIYADNSSQLKNFELKGKFPYVIYPKGEFEAELDGDFIISSD